MEEPLSLPPSPPAWVTKRDGRLVPFEADRISRALFAATEGLGRPNAFLARELTDGVVHFLAAENDGATPTTAQVAELVVKVVRELGQPAVAQAFADYRRFAKKNGHEARGPAEGREPDGLTLHFAPDEPLPGVLQTCRRQYTLVRVFARDLAAAHREGLLTLTGLDTPHELAGCVLPPVAADQPVAEALEQARQLAGEFVAIDGPEYELPAAPGVAAGYARGLAAALRAARLRAVVNLNGATPPSWADDLADGPLFTPRRLAPPAALAGELAESLLGCAAALRIDWHLGAADFAPAGEGRLLGLARRALEGAPVAFVFDRPRRPAALAEGLDRRRDAVLLTVGLSLPRLADQLGPGGEPAVYLHKLGSLARLALSAAVQKRDFLRRHGRAGALGRGFLLDRARLVVAPVGLEAAVQALLGKGVCADAAALDLARQVVRRLREVLRQDGGACQVDACLDAPADFVLDGAAGGPRAGLTAWDVGATVKDQLRAAGALHAVAEAGTAAVLVADERPARAEQVVEWLRRAWDKTDVVRLRVVRAGDAVRQRTLDGRLSV